MCAGPFAQLLLGLDHQLTLDYENILSETDKMNFKTRSHLRRFNEGNLYETLRPGFTRFSVPFYDENIIDFIVKVMELVCEHGWKLLSQYIINPETGEFTHYKNKTFKDRIWLDQFDIISSDVEDAVNNNVKNDHENSQALGYDQIIANAMKIFDHAEKIALSLGQEIENSNFYFFSRNKFHYSSESSYNSPQSDV